MNNSKIIAFTESQFSMTSAAAEAALVSSEQRFLVLPVREILKCFYLQRFLIYFTGEKLLLQCWSKSRPSGAPPHLPTGSLELYGVTVGFPVMSLTKPCLQIGQLGWTASSGKSSGCQKHPPFQNDGCLHARGNLQFLSIILSNIHLLHSR